MTCMLATIFFGPITCLPITCFSYSYSTLYLTTNTTTRVFTNVFTSTENQLKCVLHKVSISMIHKHSFNNLWITNITNPKAERARASELPHPTVGIVLRRTLHRTWAPGHRVAEGLGEAGDTTGATDCYNSIFQVILEDALKTPLNRRFLAAF